MIPIIYNADERLYDSWGIGPLSEISNARVVEEGNGLFYFTFDYPASSEMYKHLKNQNKVVTDASPELKNQVFVITRVTKPLRGMVSVYAEHISLYVTKNAGFSNKVNYNGNARDALNAWQGALITEEEVYVSSDITMTSTGTWELDKVQHARKVLGGVEGSILDVYGGEYKFNNLHISLMKSRGEDRGVQINWGKNLIDLVDEEDLNRVNTAIEPFAKLYISEEDKKEMTEEEREEAENTIFWLPEQILFSKYSDMYHYQRVALIDLTNENITSVDDLRAKATAYMDRNNFGRPKIDTKISHVDLSKTIEFQDIAEFEAIDLFDTVTVNVEKYGITGLTAKVIEVDYNPVLERYNEIRIGNTLSTRFQENVGSVKQIEASQAERFERIEREIIITQEIAGGGALIFRTEAGSSVTPIANNIGDTWYKKLGDGKTQIYVWNGIEWESILNLEELEYRIETAQSSAQTAIEEAEKANNEAIKAITGLEGINDEVLDIQGRLDPTIPDSLAYQVASHTSTIAEQGGSLETLRGEFEGLEIGGRNHWINSLMWDIGNYERIGSYDYYTVSGLKPNTDYTMSINPDIDLDSIPKPSAGNRALRINNKKENPILSVLNILSDRVETFKRTVTSTEDGTLYILNYDILQGGIGDLNPKGIILKVSSVIQDWTPAPEDLATSKEFNDYKQTSEGYFQRVQSIETDLKSGQTYTKIHDIKNTADRAESTLAQITDGDVTAYNQKISTALGDIQTIKDADYATQISTVAGRINVQIVDNGDGSKSMMDMTSNQLLYNIDGGKIQITKDKFYMDQTLIVPIIQTTKLSATQIESGTLDANKANIINLNVANIVGENANLVRGSFNAINTSINIDGTALTTKGNWGGDIKLSNRGLTIYDNLANKEMGVLYGLFRNEDDPLQAQSMLATGLFANYGYKLNIGLRNQTNNINYSVISLDTADTGKHQMNVFGDIIARYDLKMFGGMLTGAANAGYTVTEANGGHCIELANGWKIQFWRSSYQTYSSGWTEWTFPKRFTSLPRVVLAQAIRDDENLTLCQAYSFNYQGCNIRIQEKTLPWTIVAIAIGN